MEWLLTSIIRIHLMELSPPSFRTFIVGTSYQLGNLASSASATIEATLGQRYPLPPLHEGKKVIARYEYGKVMCIFLGCVSGSITHPGRPVWSIIIACFEANY